MSHGIAAHRSDLATLENSGGALGLVCEPGNVFTSQDPTRGRCCRRSAPHPHGPCYSVAVGRKSLRRRVLGWTFTAVIVGFAIAINVVNRMESDVPAPLWTVDAFDPPPEEENGWPLIAHYHSTTISGIDLAPIDNFLAASRDRPLPELGRVLSPARSVASKITKHTALCNEAFARDRMVVPCFELEKCSIEPLEICGKLVTFSAMNAASRGSPGGVRMMSQVLKTLHDAATASAHPWVQARALTELRSAIHNAAAIIKWRRGNTLALRAAVERISKHTLPIEKLVIASYLLKHRVLQDGMERTDTWLLDEGSIMRGLNAPFEAWQRSGQLPPPQTHAKGWFWWFDNPVGKKMLDMVKPGADEGYEKAVELRRTVLLRRDETLELK